MFWAHRKGQMGACVPMCTGLVTCFVAWQGTPWGLSRKCCGQQDAFVCLCYERWCTWSIVFKELILLHDSALFIERQLTEHCILLLSLLCWSPDLALHGSPSPWWLLLQGCISDCSSVFQIIAGIHMWWFLEMVAITVQIFPKVFGYRQILVQRLPVCKNFLVPLDSPYVLHPGMLKSCSADVVHMREFLMLACACTCVPLTHAQNTSVSLILPHLPSHQR